jgi:hypothetical protein
MKQLLTQLQADLADAYRERLERAIREGQVNGALSANPWADPFGEPPTIRVIPGCPTGTRETTEGCDRHP